MNSLDLDISLPSAACEYTISVWLPSDRLSKVAFAPNALPVAITPGVEVQYASPSFLVRLV